jgi:putative ABC transport system permease protein
VKQPVGPPALLERWVGAWLGRDPSTPYVVGDLREEYVARVGRGSAVTAAAWYLAQGARVAARLRWERGSRPGSPRPPVARDGIAADIRQGVRFLRCRPGFTSAIVLTVALAVASTTVAFAVVDGVLLEPLAYGTPERLVVVWESNPRGNTRNVVSPANFLVWGDDLEAFEAVAALVETSVTLVHGDEPERVGIVYASADFFEIVGAEALHGRLYDASDDTPEAERVVVLSEAYWRRRFGADPSIVGTTVRLGGEPSTVVGVLPDRYDFDLEMAFSGIGSRDVWHPQRFDADARDASGRYLQVLARLAAGSSLESARAETSAYAARLAEELPDRQRGWGINIVPLRDDLVGDARPTVLLVFGAVCFVLLIACANVASLLLTRASERGQEMAVRGAMGASRWRIVRQLLVEGTLLSVAGGALGLALAVWGVSGLVAAAPDVPRIDSVALDPSVVAFALLTTVGAALLFGLAPSLRLPGLSRAETLAGRRTSTGRETQRIRNALVVTQLALSLVLLAGAGILTRSLVNRLVAGAGFDVEGVVSAEVQLGGSYPTAEARALFFQQLVERVQGLPGVERTSAVTFPPLAGGGSRTSFWPLDRPVPPAGELPGADVRWVHRDYHETMRIPLREGRLFGVEDGADAPLVTVVNETGARQMWPGESALGKRIAMPWGDTLVAEIVGVVGDVRHEGPDTPPYPMFYWDHRQFGPFNQMSLVVRSSGSESGAPVAGIRRELAELDPALPLYNVSTMTDLLDDALRRARFATVSLGLFALVALLLACIGIYGVMGQVAARRTQEIGIRIALGASRRSILRLIVGQGMKQVGVAIAIGVAGALGLSRFLGSLVFDVSAADPATLAATALLLATVGLAACWLPARRAAFTDPVEAIRQE